MPSFSAKSAQQIKYSCFSLQKKKKDFQIELKTRIIFLGEKNGIVNTSALRFPNAWNVNAGRRDGREQYTVP